jgi:hypothetical protein
MFFLGYKLRKHIAQALSRRCTAIRNAIARYNDLAVLQMPPRPHLVYSEVVDYCTFSEFEILKHSEHDVLSKDWAILSNRQAANKFFKVERAKEEVRRCNVEVARLQAWVDAEDTVMSRAVAAHEGSDPAFAAHLRVLQMQRRHVNDHLRSRLNQIYKLPGYSGHRPPVAASSTSPAPSAVQTTAPPAPGEEDCVDGDRTDDEDELHNDEDEDEVLRLTDTLTKIMV